MKVFVYRKSTSEKVQLLNHVVMAQKSGENQLVLVTEDGEAFSCDTSKYKIVLYQN